MKKCPKCGSQWPDTANFCPRDGARTELILEGEKPVTGDETTASLDDAGPAGATPAPVAGERGFSDTQWFMAAQQPDLLKEEASTDDLFEAQRRYKRDEKIPEEERKKFSLTGKKKK